MKTQFITRKDGPNEMIGADGFLMSEIDGTYYLIWRMVTGNNIPEDKEMVHIDGDKLNNRIENLKLIAS